MKRYIILLLTLGIAFSFPAIALAQKVGSLTVVQGTVDLIPAGKAAHAAKPGEPVQVGDTVRTRKEGRAEITFDDGTIIRVARSTEMAINQFLIGDKRTDAQINLPRGKIQSVVPKKVGQLFGQQEANRFEVKTPTATCGVRGTDFFTYHQDGISGATFKEGQGYFFNNKTPDQVSTIVAGQTGTISGPEGKPVVREATKEEMRGHSKDTGASNGTNSDSGDKSAKSEGGDKDAAGGSEGQKDSKDKGKDDAPLAYTPPPPPPVDEGPKNIGPADNRNIQINIDKKITDSDTTAPVITINSAIAGDDATFGVSINEATKQLTYYLDGQKTTATTFDELADGVHTFMVEAKDLAGNVSTQSYSWTIAADIVVDSGVKPALGVDESGNNFLKLTPQGTVTAFDFTLASEGPMANDTATESVTLSLPWDTTYSLSLTYDDAPPDTVFTTETFYTDYWNSFSSGTLGDYPYGYAEGTLA
ncbi:MAG TPA: FecR family protein, partial [Desulfurivibrionaceae bacterium]|nr:FecR family protein [Desulfurivibrionaceae bacterium]